MRRRMRSRWRGAVIILVALTAMGCVSGCANAPTVILLPAPSPTATMPALPAVTPNAAIASICAGNGGSSLGIEQVQVGTLDSWQALPNDLPLKPEPVSVAGVTNNIALNVITVDVALSMPVPSASGSICAVTARIIAYQPLAAPIPNVTHTCSDHAYQDPGGPDYVGPCGGFATGPPASADIAFASSLPGTTITMPIESDLTPGRPATFPSPDGRSADVWIGLRVPVSGIYTVVFGFWQNASGPSLRVEMREEFNLNAAREWSGQACTLSSMQALLPPPTNPPTLLLCPGGPPPLA